ncbi:MAG TPA: hypothetical protein VMB50_01210 [Myxococcales bacterium]|nr:hypothetical protein [Myxococcales bacterium]
MRRFWMSSLILAITAACGPSALEDEARSALPTQDQVALQAPGGAPGTSSAAVTVGDHSDYYQLTWDMSSAVNGGVGATLLLLQAVVAQHATSCTATSCTWGPGSTALDPNTYELVVTKQATTPVSYQYVLSAEPKSNPGAGFFSLISGTATPSGTVDHGSGTFTIDFDSAQKLDNPGQTVGQLTATYDNTGPLSVQVTFLGMADTQTPSQLDNANYAYADDSSGGGDLQVAFENTTTSATTTLHSRWESDGSGRGDASYSSPTYSATASECWSTSFEVTFFESSDPSNPVFGPNSGQESACDWQGAVPCTLQAP